MSKNANCIVVGGQIASGKSSLVDALPFIGVQELCYGDNFQNILLKKMYEGDKIAGKILQFDMLLHRFEKYKNLANKNKLHVFDRSILEDCLFSDFFINEKNAKTFYYNLWKEKVKELINVIGKPKLYIFLDCNWENFKKRLFKRNRLVETNQFNKNELYFKNLLDKYKPYMMNIFKKYKLNYIIIDTNNKTKQQVFDEVVHNLNIQGIYE